MGRPDSEAANRQEMPLSAGERPAIQVGWGALADVTREGQGRPPQMRAHTSSGSAGPSRRTQLVFAAFAVAMTGAMAVLAIDTPQHAGGIPLMTVTPLEDQPNRQDLLPFTNEGEMEPGRWTGIVIHHLGEPFGTPESIHRQHLSWGYQGLGYHFLIGNGNGLANGQVYVGYRWLEQLPGAHVVGDAGQLHNAQSIGICLIGNGDRHTFSDRQIKHVTRLVQRLQRDFEIDADDVFFHSDLAPTVPSPGRLFPEAEFRAQLLDLR